MNYNMNLLIYLRTNGTLDFLLTLALLLFHLIPFFIIFTIGTLLHLPKYNVNTYCAQGQSFGLYWAYRRPLGANPFGTWLPAWTGLG